MASSEARPPVAPLPIGTPTSPLAACMTGRVTREGSTWTIKGTWSLSWDHATKSDFVYRAQGPSANTERPFCGRYDGWFLYRHPRRAKRHQETKLELNFTPNSEGGHNVEGISVNEFCTTAIRGIHGRDGRIRLVKYSDETLTANPAPGAAPGTQAAAQAAAAARKPRKGPGRPKKAGTWIGKCDKIMKVLIAQADQAYWFVESVEDVAREKPDYLDRIAHPMDFKKIQAKLRKSKYNKPADFAADVRLTFENAKTYYVHPQHPCVVAAEALGALFEKKYTMLNAHLRGSGVHGPVSPARSPGRAPGKPAKVTQASPAPTPEPRAPKSPVMARAALSPIPETKGKVAAAHVHKPRPKVADERPRGRVSAAKAKPKASGLWQTQAIQIIRCCQSSPDTVWFNQPVPSDLPGYTAVIKEPMDLATLERKLKARRYVDMDAFLADARLIFSNAMTFNRVGEPCYNAAEALSRRMEEKIRDLTGRPSPAGPEAQATAPAAQAAASARPKPAPQAKEVALSHEEKEKLEADVGELADEDADRVLDMLENCGADLDEDGEVDLDRIPVAVQRRVQAFVHRCLHPEEAAADGPAAAPVTAGTEEPGLSGTPAAAAGSAPAADGVPAHAMRGKTVDAPPMPVAANLTQPDSARTDRETSPQTSPRAASDLDGREPPRASNPVLQRVASTIAGDVTSSSSDDDSDDEAVRAPVKRKREADVPTSAAEAVGTSRGECAVKRAKVESALPVRSAADFTATGSGESGESDAAIAETVTHGTPMDIEGPTAVEAAAPAPVPVVKAPSLNAWMSSAAAFEEGEPVVGDMKRGESTDQDSKLWAESLKKSEELKNAEKVRLEEEQERQASIEAQRAADEHTRLQLAQERKERLLAQEREAEKVARQKELEAEKVARVAREGVGGGVRVNLDEDENLLEEFL